MKYKITFITALLVMLNCLTTKANDFNSNYNFNSYAKITEIDAALNEAKSFEEIKAVAFKMYAMVCEHFNDTCPPPKTKFLQLMCSDVTTRAKPPANEQEYYEYYYEKRFWEMACVNIGIDNEETIKRKLQLFWNK